MVLPTIGRIHAFLLLQAPSLFPSIKNFPFWILFFIHTGPMQNENTNNSCDFVRIK